jgi:hypothetical protein
MAAARLGTLIPLTYESRVAGFTHILRVTYLDLLQMTSGTAQAFYPQNSLASAVNVFPIGTFVRQVVPNVVVAATSSGGAITTLTYSLGDGGSATRFVNAQDGKTAAYGTAYTSKFVYTAADTIDLTATIAGQTMASLTAGQVDFYLEIVDASQLVNVVAPSAA